MASNGLSSPPKTIVPKTTTRTTISNKIKAASKFFTFKFGETWMLGAVWRNLDVESSCLFSVDGLVQLEDINSNILTFKVWKVNFT